MRKTHLKEHHSGTKCYHKATTTLVSNTHWQASVENNYDLLKDWKHFEISLDKSVEDVNYLTYYTRVDMLYPSRIFFGST